MGTKWLSDLAVASKTDWWISYQLLKRMKGNSINWKFDQLEIRSDALRAKKWFGSIRSGLVSFSALTLCCTFAADNNVSCHWKPQMSLLMGLLGKIQLKSSFLWQAGQWLVKAFSTLNLQHTEWFNLRLNCIECFSLSVHKTALVGMSMKQVFN